MFEPREAFSGFSVDDLAKAKEFYAEVLGLKLEERPGGMRISLPAGRTVWACASSVICDGWPGGARTWPIWLSRRSCCW